MPQSGKTNVISARIKPGKKIYVYIDKDPKNPNDLTLVAKKRILGGVLGEWIPKDNVTQNDIVLEKFRYINSIL